MAWVGDGWGGERVENGLEGGPSQSFWSPSTMPPLHSAGWRMLLVSFFSLFSLTLSSPIQIEALLFIFIFRVASFLLFLICQISRSRDSSPFPRSDPPPPTSHHHHHNLLSSTGCFVFVFIFFSPSRRPCSPYFTHLPSLFAPAQTSFLASPCTITPLPVANSAPGNAASLCLCHFLHVHPPGLPSSSSCPKKPRICRHNGRDPIVGHRNTSLEKPAVASPYVISPSPLSASSKHTKPLPRPPGPPVQAASREFVPRHHELACEGLPVSSRPSSSSHKFVSPCA